MIDSSLRECRYNAKVPDGEVVETLIKMFKYKKIGQLSLGKDTVFHLIAMMIWLLSSRIKKQRKQ